MRTRIVERIRVIRSYLIEKTNSDVENAKLYIAEACHAATTAIGIDFIRYKHPSFAEEHEWRFVFGVQRSAGMPKEFRAGKYGIIPYINVSSGILADAYPNKWPWVEAWIGPSVYGKLSASSLKAFLEANGYPECDVFPPTIPFRP